MSQFINRNHFSSYDFLFLLSICSFQHKFNNLYSGKVNNFICQTIYLIKMVSHLCRRSVFSILQNRFYHKHQYGYDCTTQCSCCVGSVRLRSENGCLFDDCLRIAQMRIFVILNTFENTTASAVAW